MYKGLLNCSTFSSLNTWIPAVSPNSAMVKLSLPAVRQILLSSGVSSSDQERLLTGNIERSAVR